MFRAIQAVQVALSLATVGLVGLVGRRLAGPAAQVWATGFMALNPFLATFAGWVMTETLFIFLVWAALHQLQAFAAETGRRRSWRLVGAGVVLALGCLCRPTLQALLPFVALWAGWRVWRTEMVFCRRGQLASLLGGSASNGTKNRGYSGARTRS